MKQAVDFWQALLSIKPHKTFDTWHEFMIGDVRLGLLLNDFNDKYIGSNCVPVFEFTDTELINIISKVKELKVNVIEDGLENPDLLSLVCKDPFGNEFELSKYHD
jgi:hypothetical protein